MAAVKKAWIFSVIAGLGAVVAVIAALQPENPVETSYSSLPREEPQKVATHTVAKLKDRFSRIGYDLNYVVLNDMKVPRIWSDAVPSDMHEIKQADVRKELFLQMMLPLVLMANERIERDRARVVALAAKMKKGTEIAPGDKSWLDRMYVSYKVKPGKINNLLARVDVVPVSLALAQAAIESGWGSSRFARQGNALFGEWTWNENNKGIVPDSRDEGKTHRIRAFDSPLDSVASYLHNLNTHRAYRELRSIRALARRQGQMVSGLDLTSGLIRYSEKGGEYVDLLQSVIRTNDLAQYDQARLADRQYASAPRA
ncbi:glucosaminidase domain-containing protein [Aestuariispira insulae]|uniref:Bax protein n=1 Tax=Aestuariispira insulae TaxID=1461337 RepID=A0A3D9HPV6_9PROT|nr:glucosaminidase domain-containing protein [Aestuariispira insulae]RED51489.1 Bax protein [Aestuariispira insulae]